MLLCVRLYAIMCALRLSGCVCMCVWVRADAWIGGWGCKPCVLQIMSMCVYVRLCARACACLCAGACLHNLLAYAQIAEVGPRAYACASFCIRRVLRMCLTYDEIVCICAKQGSRWSGLLLRWMDGIVILCTCTGITITISERDYIYQSATKKAIISSIQVEKKQQCSQYIHITILCC